MPKLITNGKVQLTLGWMSTIKIDFMTLETSVHCFLYNLVPELVKSSKSISENLCRWFKIQIKVFSSYKTGTIQLSGPDNYLMMPENKVSISTVNYQTQTCILAN
jgi:hypothetical protein